MTNELNYTRVRSLQELNALDAGPESHFLIGGDYTVGLPANTRKLVDLQDLDLADLTTLEGWQLIPAMVSLQKAIQALEAFPALAEAASLEGGRNLRNSLSLGNYLRHGDANGPLRVCLAAMSPQIGFMRQDEPKTWAASQALLAQGILPVYGIFSLTGQLVFESIGRSPKDKPTVCLGVHLGKDGSLRVAVSHPQAGIKVLELENSQEPQFEALEAVLADSGDAWASAAYRQGVAQTLLQRALNKLGAENKEAGQ